MTLAERDEVEEHELALPAGTTVHVRIRGRGPYLLLINGIGGHVAMWSPLADELSRTRRLVMFDAPGTGASPPLPKFVRMPALADVLMQLLDELHITSLDVLGYSWGGALAQQFARSHPTRVLRLVLVATVPGVGGRPPKLQAARAMLTPDRFEQARQGRESASLIYGGDYRSDNGRGGKQLPAAWHALPPSARGYAQQLFAITGWSSLPWLRRIDHRVLVISGDDDPLVPTVNAHILQWLIPRSRLHLVEGGGHLWLLDHPRTSADVIERFLKGS